MWIKDSSGSPSASVTLLFVAFAVMTVSVLLSLFESIGPLQLRPISESLLATYFTPIIALYGGRRWTSAKYGSTELISSEE